MALNTGTKIGLGVVLAGALGVLVLSDTGEGVLEYVYVDKVMEAPTDYTGRTIQVHGKVVEGTVRRNKNDKGDYRFVIEREGKQLPVHFTNIPPDTFQEGGEVILTGRLAADASEFTSDQMSAKCPSKYEEEQSLSKGSKRG